MLDPKEEALLIFRKMVFALYQEIGALTPHIHRKIARKADIEHGFFHGERKQQAAVLYSKSEALEDPDEIVAPYVERTNLTLEDVYQAFYEGDWRNKFGGFNLGGPRWAKIAEAAIELRDAIRADDWDAASYKAYEIKKLRTNQGTLVNLFNWTERTPRKRID